MHKIVFFSNKKNKYKIYVCLSHLKFSDPLPETHLFFLFGLIKGTEDRNPLALIGHSFQTLGPSKVGRSKPPPILTSGFNRLKPPRSISQKVVNTGQYESEWSIEFFKWRFWWWIEILGQVICRDGVLILVLVLVLTRVLFFST